MQQNAFTPLIDSDTLDRYRRLQRELAGMDPSAYPGRRSCVEAQIDHLREMQIWHMRLIELTLASVLFFCLGFAIAARCL